MKRNLAFVIVASLFLALTVSAQEGKDTAPADQAEQKQKEKPAMSMGDMMKRCMEHCQATAKSIEETTDAIEAAKKGNDPQKMRAALDQAQKQLEGMREHMSMCTNMMGMMQKMHGGMMGDGQGKWTCPMHPQVAQDKPGKCPMCKMELTRTEGAPKGEASKEEGQGERQ